LSQHLPILNEKAANNLQAVLRSINESHEQKGKGLPPSHPGEILREDFLAPLGLSMNELALDLRVPVTRIAEIIHERRGITLTPRCAWPAISILARDSGSIFRRLTILGLRKTNWRIREVRPTIRAD